jgi:hypothetical protein
VIFEGNPTLNEPVKPKKNGLLYSLKRIREGDCGRSEENAVIESDLITRNFEEMVASMTPVKELELSALPYHEFLETPYWRTLGRYLRLLHGDRCDRCGHTSDLQVHHHNYDHVGAEYRHLQDLAVLCDSCHGTVHGATTGASVSNLYDFNRDRLRDGQKKALDKIFQRVEARERYTAIIIPTRYGKSDLMRVAAIQLYKHGLIGVAVALSPFTQLNEQLDRHDHWIESIERYDLPRTSAHRILEGREEDYSANGECFRCATLQFVRGVESGLSMCQIIPNRASTLCGYCPYARECEAEYGGAID